MIADIESFESVTRQSGWLARWFWHVYMIDNVHGTTEEKCGYAFTCRGAWRAVSRFYDSALPYG